MPAPEKEKHYPNSRARRHSGEVIITQSKKKRSKKDKDKDGDTESISSTNSGDTVIPPPPRCPLRFMLAGLLETEDEAGEKKPKGCPLRRVQLWHTIPLCLLAVINLLLVIIALLGLAGYRIALGIQSTVLSLAKPESPYAESLADTDDGTLVGDKR
ncbi:hypothetical protein BDZ45DRAFT_405897 [Acephala macrosclerotiorum]|nr:hypothetical protein BDZ45DRAFT_405897 [Acephala macrosclerotiorum]